MKQTVQTLHIKCYKGYDWKAHCFTGLAVYAVFILFRLPMAMICYSAPTGAGVASVAFTLF
jgi:hypothetical protein